MLDLPTDKPDIVAKGLTALADFAGGLTLDPEEVDKERGVVIEEWRGGLGAGSRIRDKQFPSSSTSRATPSACRSASPRSSAPRPPRGCARSTTPGTGPSAWRSSPSATSIRPQIESAIARDVRSAEAARARRSRRPTRPCRCRSRLLVSVVDRSRTHASIVELVRKRPARADAQVADYRRDLVRQLIEHMFNERFCELARKPDAKFLGAGVGDGRLRPDRRHVHDRRARPGRQARRGPRRARHRGASASSEFGFTRRRAGSREEVDGRASTSAPTPSATRPRAARSRRNTCSYFLEGEPTPGHRLRVSARAAAAARHHARRSVGATARRCSTDDSRVVLARRRRRRPALQVPTEAELHGGARAAASTPPSPRGTTVDGDARR